MALSKEEEKILNSIVVPKDNKVVCEASGIAGLALMLQMKNKLPKTKKMLIVNTGKSLFPK